MGHGDATHQWEGTVLELHLHAFKCPLSFQIRHIKKIQMNGLVVAKHVAISNFHQQRIRNSTGGASDSYTPHRLFPRQTKSLEII